MKYLSPSAAYGGGGWWFRDCHLADLNGIYYTPGPTASYGDGVVWAPWKGYFWSLATTTMMVR